MIIIDFGSNNRKLVPIDFPWKLRPREVTPPKRLFFKRRKSAPEPVDLIVMVESIRYNNKLVCDNGNLFYIRYENQDYLVVNNPRRVIMTEAKAPFSLIFNPNAVTDCSNPTINFDISFNLTIYDGKLMAGNPTPNHLSGRTPVSRIPMKITVNVKCPDIEPEFFIDIDDEVPFSRLNPQVQLGSIIAKCNINIQYQPKFNIDLQPHLYLQGREIDDALSLGRREEKKDILFNQSITLDMSHLTNPRQSEEQYQIKLTGSFCVEGEQTRKPLIIEPKDLIIKRDNQVASLQTYIGNDTIDGKNPNGCTHQLKQHNFTIGTKFLRENTFTIKNLSSDDTTHGAGVLVRNLKYSTLVSGARLMDRGMNDISSKAITMYGGELPRLQSTEGLYLPNGVGGNSQVSVKIKFDPTAINSIEWASRDFYLFTAICNIDFDYIENPSGADISTLEQNLRHFHATVKQPAFLEPNPDWLCVDYGSSAIVAVYADNLLNLRQQKTRIIQHDPVYNSLATDTLENDTPFLSSDIVLHDITRQDNNSFSSLSSQNRDNAPFNKLAVCLSPTSSMLTNFFNYQIPCLKMLVGNNKLPANPNYEINYYYKTNPQEPIQANQGLTYSDAKSIEPESESCILSVINVFREAYHELFRYFIVPQVGQLDRINQLVLTYPNTYTPVHIKIIRDIVSNLFPAVRLDSLRFVSESDAVAAYYMRHWSDYHPAGANINSNENILVYDMGAGTLDVTLLQKRSSGDRHQLNIVGKLGTCKAGNYLDNVIAQIVCAHPDMRLNPLLASTDDAPTLINQRMELKLAIKNQIKPLLNSSNSDPIEFTLGGNTKTINPQNIIEHELFEGYIDDVTKGIVNQLCRYLGCNRLQVNTVLMSGRSCRLEPLQKALTNTIMQSCDYPECNFVMLDKPNGSNSNRAIAKTSVAEGATTYAAIYSNPDSPVKVQSRKLYANYGIAFKGTQENWQYIELLNHSQSPNNDDNTCHQFRSVTINGLSLAQNLHLVQSYLSSQDTNKQLQAGKMDYISIMGTFSRNDYHTELQNGDSLTACIELNENGELSLMIGDMKSVGQLPSSTDLENETTQRSFWPVRVKF